MVSNMQKQNLDPYAAWALGLILIGEHGRVQLEGTRWRYYVAEHDGLTVKLYLNRVPMVLSIDAPSRVLEFESDNLEGDNAKVVRHEPGPWQDRLYEATKRRRGWRAWVMPSRKSPFRQAGIF
jgi:hypothetical protein